MRIGSGKDKVGRVDLLCIHELGYMELDRRGADLLTFGGQIIETGTDSYRLAQTRAPTATAYTNSGTT